MQRSKCRCERSPTERQVDSEDDFDWRIRNLRYFGEQPVLLILLSSNRNLAIMQSWYLRWPGHLALSQSLACSSQFLEPHAGSYLSCSFFWISNLLVQINWVYKTESHNAKRLSWVIAQLNCRRRLTWALEVRSSKDLLWRRFFLSFLFFYFSLFFLVEKVSGSVFSFFLILLSTAFLLEGDKVEGHRHRLVGYLSQTARGSLRTSPQRSRDPASSNHCLPGTWGGRGALFLHGGAQVWEIFWFFVCFCFYVFCQVWEVPAQKHSFEESCLLGEHSGKGDAHVYMLLTAFSLSINLRRKISWFWFWRPYL